MDYCSVTFRAILCADDRPVSLEGALQLAYIDLPETDLVLYGQCCSCACCLAYGHTGSHRPCEAKRIRFYRDTSSTGQQSVNILGDQTAIGNANSVSGWEQI